MTYSVFIPNAPYRLDQRLKETETSSVGKHYAVLIAGSSEDRHKNNLSMSYQVLLEQGYERENIFIFDSSGGDPPIFPITDQTTSRTLQIMFTWLEHHITSNDTLLIYMTGHGQKIGPIKRSAYSLNKGEHLLKDDFIQMLKPINPKAAIVFGDFCYWGAIQGHSELNEYIFITAVDDDHVSYGTTFARAFWKAFRRSERRITILEAYLDAVINDPFSNRKNANNPSLSFISIKPESINLLGEIN